MSSALASRTKKFFELLLAAAPKVKEYESTGSLIDQLIDNILEESLELDEAGIEKFKSRIFEEFVDWNEVRLVSADRLVPYFGTEAAGVYCRKALQALLNKIFSRSGSLDYQFLMDFESEDLEDYLAGIMEMNEGTRKRLLLRVFKKRVSPISTDHEIIFEKAEIEVALGDDVKNVIAEIEPLDLERLQLLLDKILGENGEVEPGLLIQPEDFKSITLNRILKKL